MAGTLRVRLHFEYPPPALWDCRMCWMLVDTNRCRVVADLASDIRDKFEFSRSTALSLYVEECYLPPTESVCVVRDNDTISVKVEVLPQPNGCASAELPDVSCMRKRKREEDEEQTAKSESCQVQKRQKDKVQDKTSLDEVAPVKKKKKKKKKKKVEQHPETTKAQEKDAASAGKVKGKAAPRRHSHSSTSSGDETSTIPASQSRPSSTVPARKSTPTSKPSADAPSVPAVVTKETEAPAKVEAGSSSEDELVIKKPAPPPWACFGRGGARGRGAEPVRGMALGRGVPRGAPWSGHGRGGRGSTMSPRWKPGQQHNSASWVNGDQAGDTLSNHAVILQNPPVAPPQRDYNSLPLLAAPPQVGQKIAFKLLELTENYMPEVSSYKEGKIVSYDQSTRLIELQLFSSAPAPVQPGKFDLVYQNPDGSEVVEYAVTRSSQLSERWESLLEPRLILENGIEQH